MPVVVAHFATILWADVSTGKTEYIYLSTDFASSVFIMAFRLCYNFLRTAIRGSKRDVYTFRDLARNNKEEVRKLIEDVYTEFEPVSSCLGHNSDDVRAVKSECLEVISMLLLMHMNSTIISVDQCITQRRIYVRKANVSIACRYIKTPRNYSTNDNDIPHGSVQYLGLILF